MICDRFLAAPLKCKDKLSGPRKLARNLLETWPKFGRNRRSGRNLTETDISQIPPKLARNLAETWSKQGNPKRIRNLAEAWPKLGGAPRIKSSMATAKNAPLASSGCPYLMRRSQGRSARRNTSKFGSWARSMAARSSSPPGATSASSTRCGTRTRSSTI